jgi:CubicO group peptidase (beta-lactamase class C family)
VSKAAGQHYSCPVSDRDLTGLLREHASKNVVPGAAIGVLRDGEAATAYYGVADMTTGEPVTSDTRFAVGSLGKPMAATVVARVAKAGRLEDDRLYCVLGERPATQP